MELYSKAIDLNPNVAAYYGNRSFCYLKTELYGAALGDANIAIELDKKYIKVSGSASEFTSPGLYSRNVSHSRGRKVS